jgi:signal transduction histidine kinase
MPLIVSIFVAALAYLGLRIRKKEEKVLEMKSQIVAIASHELKSPLMGISWTLQQLSEARDIHDVYKHKLSQAAKSSEDLLSIINDILRAASLESATTEKLSKVSLASLLVEVTKNLSLVAEQKRVKIILPKTLPKKAYVFANEKLLLEAFLNICSNAIKYSHKGSSVEISLATESNDYCISIQDKGIGIPPSEVEKVFSGFYRASNARIATINGSGLGLYIVKKIIESYKGTIALESEVNKGTKVTICIPKAVQI